MSHQHSIPFIVHKTTPQPLQMAKVHFKEKWLQEFIFSNYHSLPIEEIEPVFLPLIPVCTELGTKVGPVDIVFINEKGLLTLVECKLWENPQARREVVGQILDYAGEISRWSYENLEAAVKSRLKKSLFEIAATSSEDLDESGFIDNVTRNLKRGRFLLLIVGNGIRENVEQIAEFLQKHAHLNFSFALIEVGIFQLPEELGEGYLIYPRVLAQTVVIERAVIRVEEGKWVAEMIIEPENRNVSRRSKISEEAFFEELENRAMAQELRQFFDNLLQIGLILQPGQNSMKIKYTVGDTEFNLGTFNTNSTFQNYGIAAVTQQIGYPDIGEEYLHELASLFQDGFVSNTTPNKFRWTVKKKNNQYFTLAECLAVQDQWLELIQKTIARIDEVIQP